MKNKKTALAPIVWLIILALCWEVVGRLFPNNYFLPPFSSVVSVLVKEITQGSLLLQCGYSFILAIIGVIVSCIAAIIVFSLCVVNKYIASLTKTLCGILNPLPSVAIIPLAMFILGLGDSVLVLLICHSVVWPLLKNMLAGYSAINPIFLEFFANANFKKTVYLYHVIIPSVLKDLLMGMKIAWGRAFRTLIAVEMIFGTTGALGGLGYYIYIARANAESEKLYAGIILISLLGIIVENFLFCFLERNTINKWGIYRT